MIIIMMIASYTNDDDLHHDDDPIVHTWMMMINIMMIIASYIHDDVDDDRIAHSLTIYNAANFVTDGQTNKAILGVGWHYFIIMRAYHSKSIRILENLKTLFLKNGVLCG